MKSQYYYYQSHSIITDEVTELSVVICYVHTCCVYVSIFKLQQGASIARSVAIQPPPQDLTTSAPKPDNRRPKT